MTDFPQYRALHPALQAQARDTWREYGNQTSLWASFGLHFKRLLAPIADRSSMWNPVFTTILVLGFAGRFEYLLRLLNTPLSHLAAMFLRQLLIPAHRTHEACLQ